MSVLFMIRHGQATLDGSNYDQLSPLGRVQAEMLGTLWAKQRFVVDYAYSGTQTRHRDTAHLVAAGYREAGLNFPEVIPDERFNEIDSFDFLEKIYNLLLHHEAGFRSLTKDTRHALDTNSPEKYVLFDRCMQMIMTAWIEERFPDAEALSWDDYRNLVLSTQADLAQLPPESRIAVFTSGNPIAIYAGRAGDAPTGEIRGIAHRLLNTAVSHFTLNGAGITLESLNETPHLGEAYRTQK